MAVRGKVFRLPKRVPIEMVQKALTERRNFEEFLNLAFGPVALGPKPIRVSAEQLNFTKAVLLETEQAEESSDTAEVVSKTSRRYGNLVPVLQLWFIEHPRIARNLDTYINVKLGLMNGEGFVESNQPVPKVFGSPGGNALRTKAIERWRHIFEVGKKKCSKCGRVKAFDQFGREANPYYPEVGEPMRPSVWCTSCQHTHGSGSKKKTRGKED